MTSGQRRMVKQIGIYAGLMPFLLIALLPILLGLVDQ
jgi:hypothetical protein